MTYRLRFLLPLFLIILGFSCNYFHQNQQEKAIARVFDKYLYSTDIESIVQHGTSMEDSTEIVRSYINNWIRQNLLIQKAELNLPEEKKNVTQPLKDYRNSLIIFAYEKELIKQNLDTNVSNEEITAYYEQHQNDFLLKDYIVRVIYLKLEKNTPNLKKVKKWFYSDDRISLEKYCIQFAVNYFLNDERWITFDEVLKEIPIKTYNKELFLESNKSVELESIKYLYWLRIKEFRLKDNISPLEFETKRIKNIIVNKRKLELINNMKNDVYQEALIKKHFEVYGDE